MRYKSFGMWKNRLKRKKKPFFVLFSLSPPYLLLIAAIKLTKIALEIFLQSCVCVLPPENCCPLPMDWLYHFSYYFHFSHPQHPSATSMKLWIVEVVNQFPVL